jgi:hypothetical protein
MRTRIGPTILVIASLVASEVSANEPAKSGSPAECSSPSALAFGKVIKGAVARSAKSGKNAEASWTKNPDFRKWAAEPKSTLAEVERYLRCSPTATASEVRLAMLTLHCLEFDAYLDHLKRLSQAAKSEAVGRALFYALAPGFLRSSNQLASDYADANVKSILKLVMTSPNATPGLQRMVVEILDGSTKKALEEHPAKPLLTCASGASK